MSAGAMDSSATAAVVATTERPHAAWLRAYREAGLRIFPVEHGGKKPHAGFKWTARELPAEINEWGLSPAPNIGCQLVDSDGRTLIEVDPDDDSGVCAQLAHVIFGDAGFVWGRKGRRGKCLYRIDGDLPSGSTGWTALVDGAEGKAKVIFELKWGAGRYTILPPGVHASGERIEHDGDHDTVTSAEFHSVLSKAQVCAIGYVLVKYWGPGTRDELLMCAVRVLKERLGLSEHKVYMVLKLVMEITGDEEIRERLKKLPKKFAKPRQGVPRLRKIITGERDWALMRECLGLDAPQRVNARPQEADVANRLEHLDLDKDVRAALLGDPTRISALGQDIPAGAARAVAKCGVRIAEGVPLLQALAGPVGDVVRDRGALFADDYRQAIAAVTPTFVRDTNATTFFAPLGGKSVVVREAEDDLVFMTPEGFARLDNTAVRNHRGAPSTQSRAWLESPLRRGFTGITLDPTQDRETRSGEYNLWRGFAVEPSEIGTFDLFRHHLRENICGGDDQQFNYLWRWLAHGVQHPERRAEVAPVLHGVAKGTGKTTVSEVYGHLWGKHYQLFDNSNQALGRFNGHYARLLFIGWEEAVWAGSKETLGRFKAIITQRDLGIEYKGKDIVFLPNRTKMLITSNEPWVVPASEHERRFFVVDVPAHARTQDRQWFAELRRELKAGGYARLLHDLLTADLSGFDITDIPQTEALREQQVQGVDDIVGFILHALEEEFWHSDWQFAAFGVVPKGYVYAAYLDYCRQRTFSAKNQNAFGMKFCKVLALTKDDKTNAFVEYHAIGARPDKDGVRHCDQHSKAYVLPDSVEECRQRFEAYMGWRQGYAWPPAKTVGAAQVEKQILATVDANDVLRPRF